MSSPAPPPADRATIAASAAAVLSTLPAQFLVLVLLNTAFIGGLLWFLNNRANQQERTLMPILTTCMHQIPLDVLQEFIRAIPREQPK